ncbi:nuclear transport factor 2 family protein [Streptomyces litchfieldiae]|uniref:Nuclear transport factor 2 family protein n=1 Tax=Streptomyces litchfieldiae TaxID=3075543 RepID=A0ABU2N3R1_9ACTN|nr:nuclear transport factor 2 family protein [Streptomyces sp. DSM 44938]MDT0347349.1 nuclear transport factor 2 family protein [Streptomyces sp. DSM 44938]
MTTTSATPTLVELSRKVAELSDRVRELTDRSEISTLVDAYFLSMDRRRFDSETVASLFTPDVTFDFPVGGSDLSDYAEAFGEVFGWYKFTHHVSGNHIVRLDGDRATLRWNAIMVHVHSDATVTARGLEPGARFDTGGVFEAEAVRTADGWRFRRLVLTDEVGWTNGTPPPAGPAL